MEHNLYARTAAAGIYDLRPGTAVSNELAALDAGLSWARTFLSEMTAALYPLSAPYEMLKAWCALYGYAVPSGLDGTALRRAAAALTRPPGCSRAALEAYFRALGCAVRLTEQTAQRRVLVGGETFGGLFEDSDALMRALRRLLPVGVTAALDIGELTWALLDAMELDAAAIDARGLTWSEFDAAGHPAPEEAI
ncbi:hypothetical protein AALA99_09695 [Anaerotruncus colihominis]|jgi:hypothetical protein|uniref:hypothetical protein n=1 Tax=Anaerotruncus TaxID=244127 RepID=UPI0021719BD1|nr:MULTISPECIES: hypothetical protein [Anaerotruncus]MCI8493178.1 hypothetical protein [Anaerotruncus sp.]